MALWKIEENGPTPVDTTRFRDEELLEKHLEDWVAQNAELLGEPLFVIGRQVTIPDVKDRLDLLALDPAGNAVVIELKRGTLKDPADVQALRYASYISKWGFEHFEQVAANYHGDSDEEYNFNAEFEAFVEEAGIEEAPNLNEDQRIIIVGSSVRERLGSVALWLSEHAVDIRLIEVTAYKNEDELFLEPSVIVPLPVSRFDAVGKSRPVTTPWRSDGRTWHLEKRCSERTRTDLLALDQLLQDELGIDGGRWGQKHYVAYRGDNHNRLYANTGAQRLRLDFRVNAGVFSADELAERLDVVEFEKDESLSEKLGLPSSVTVMKQTEQRDTVRLLVKEDFDLQSEAFVAFLREAYEERYA